MCTAVRALWFRIRSRFRRSALEAELEEEMRFHRERLAEELRSGGTPEGEARRLAAARLGNLTVLHERSREWWSLGWLEAAAQDVRYAARLLFNTTARSAGPFLLAALVLGVVAVFASLLPVYSATRVDPATSLRSE